MVYIKDLKNTDGNIIYPRTKTKAITNDAGVNLDELLRNGIGQGDYSKITLSETAPDISTQKIGDCWIKITGTLS